MTCSLKFLVATTTGLALVSCAYRPPLTPEGDLPIKAVMDVVECELYKAYHQHFTNDKHAWFKEWAASAELTVKVEDIGEAALDPLSNVYAMSGWTLNFGVFATAENRNTRTATAKFSFKLKTLQAAACAYADRPDKQGTIFSGDLGIKDWITRVVSTVSPKQDTANPASFGYFTEFGFKKKAGVTPGFEVLAIKGGSTLSLSREDIGTLNIVFQDDPPAVAQHVIIDNWQGNSGKARAMPSANETVKVYRGTILKDTQRSMDNNLQQMQFKNLRLSPLR